MSDAWGGGWYGAPRGRRKHHGVDLIAYPGAPIVSATGGVFTWYGYPYDPEDSRKGHLRYVQITDDEGLHFRYFYVQTDLKIGDRVEAGQVIGSAQGLWDVYDERMTNHIHFEVKKGATYLNPNDFV